MSGGVLRKAALFANLIRYEHTVFALPFAYTGMFLAARGLPAPGHPDPRGWPTAAQFFWVTVAMVGARSAAMAINRLADRDIDAKNPRTAGRPLPRGLLTVAETAAFAAASLALMFWAAARLNPLCVRLAPVAVAALAIYPYAKRFTWTSHFFLALAQAAAPIGGWLAVTGAWHPAAVLLGAAAGLWVGAFDIIYATQDADCDRREGLHSAVVRFGTAGALWLARAVHALVVALFAALHPMLGLGPWYLAAVAMMAVLLAAEHRLVTPRDLSRVGIAFFTVNGIISIVFFGLVVADVAW